MRYREDELNQAIFAAYVLGNPSVDSRTDRESLRNGSEKNHEHIDAFIDTHAASISDYLKKIIGEIRERGQNPDEVGKQLGIPEPLTELAQNVLDNPKMLTAGTLACLVFKMSSKPEIHAFRTSPNSSRTCYERHIAGCEAVYVETILKALDPQVPTHGIYVSNQENFPERDYGIAFRYLRNKPCDRRKLRGWKEKMQELSHDKDIGIRTVAEHDQALQIKLDHVKTHELLAMADEAEAKYGQVNRGRS